MFTITVNTVNYACVLKHISTGSFLFLHLLHIAHLQKVNEI